MQFVGDSNAIAAGRGGSPEIIEHAVGRGVQVVWIDAARLRLPRLIRATWHTGRAGGPLAAPASRTPPLTAAAVGKLAAKVTA